MWLGTIKTPSFNQENQLPEITVGKKGLQTFQFGVRHDSALRNCLRQSVTSKRARL